MVTDSLTSDSATKRCSSGAGGQSTRWAMLLGSDGQIALIAPPVLMARQLLALGIVKEALICGVVVCLNVDGGSKRGIRTYPRFHREFVRVCPCVLNDKVL